MFPGPTLRSALSGALEAALNRALALDPAGRRALLAALAGPVQFEVGQSQALTLTLRRQEDRVRLGTEPAEDAVLVLRGSVLAFAALALGDRNVFAEGRIAVSGDTALAHQFQRALAQLDPDWEAALAARIGDLPAHFLGQRLREALAWRRQAADRLTRNLEEYIHEESRQLPGRRELEATFADIDDLTLRVERLEARLTHLDNKARARADAKPSSPSSPPESP
ncbi:MAG: SCP2 sterol-binding domain-containing protein [Marinobacter sp.]|uniref:ubiquinone biosynthesis accessory factor UbiJ n=1 Tax=Marinobacter sp. TaxID=50741 RepID=UPI00299F3A93|nr:SCP2 sterol-binding domain-containing protein [Marinobacter sp.]MDX1633312.1 SCP2 sterol-binding domain-containing protein [Marinobacter sp.]